MSEMRMRRRGGGGFEQDDDDSKRRRPRVTLESFDLYAKTAADETVKTSTGAGVSIVAVILVVLLLCSELYNWLKPRRAEHMVVDPVVEGRLRINFDLTLHSLPCSQANLDAMDVAGEQQNGIDHDITKTRLGPDGKPISEAVAVRIEPKQSDNATAQPTPLPADYCGSCFGAQSRDGQCCNTCAEVKQAYADKGWDSVSVARTAEQCVREGPAGGHNHGEEAAVAGEGCRLTGFMLVNKVAGNFHIAMGETHARGAGHIHQFNPAQLLTFNVSHTLHSLSFGEPYEGQKNPLDGTTRISQEGSGVYYFYMKVIPTVVVGKGPDMVSDPATGASVRGNLTTNQYSVSVQYRPAMVNGQRQNVLPGLFFVYEISPFMVTITESRVALIELLTGLLALLGGVISLAKFVDVLLDGAARLFKVGVGAEQQEAIAGAIAAASSSLRSTVGSLASPLATGPRGPTLGSSAYGATAGGSPVAGAGATGGSGSPFSRAPQTQSMAAKLA